MVTDIIPEVKLVNGSVNRYLGMAVKWISPTSQLPASAGVDARVRLLAQQLHFYEKWRSIRKP